MGGDCPRKLPAAWGLPLAIWVGYAFLATLRSSIAFAANDAEAATAAQDRVGRLIRVAGAIDDKLERAVHRQVQDSIGKAKSGGKWPVLIFEIQGGPTDFYRAQKMASFISGEELSGATTVAYIPEDLSGHSVLLALACDQILIHPDKRIGAAGERQVNEGGTISASMKDAYASVAKSRQTVPAAVAVAMLDPSVELLRVDCPDPVYALRDELDGLRAAGKRFAEPTIIKPPGKAGVFLGTEFREMGFASYLATSRDAVAKALDLPREAVEDDPSADGEWRTARFDLKGPLTTEKLRQVERGIDDQLRSNNANFILLWIDTAGGAPTDSVQLVNHLLSLDPAKTRTVAYVVEQARGDAAFIALACDHIVIRPRATLGGAGEYEIPDGDLQLMVGAVEEIADRKLRSRALCRGMVDPEATVRRYVRKADSHVEYFTDEEFAALAVRGETEPWSKQEAIKSPGKTLSVDGAQALKLGLAHDQVEDLEELKKLYGLENDPTLVAPGWADSVIETLKSREVGWILLAVGFIAFIGEMQSPGVGVGGLIAAICLLLYFWSAFLGGTAGWLEVLLFVAGMLFLSIELFVLPGFGVFGLAGGLLVICSLILASQTFVIPRNEYQLGQLRNSLLGLTLVGAATISAAIALRRYLPRAPMLNRVLLAPPSAEEAQDIARRESVAAWDHLLGERGITDTPLMPAGKARIGEQLVDVMSNGEFIDRGKAVRVVEARGNRVVVSEEA